MIAALGISSSADSLDDIYDEVVNDLNMLNVQLGLFRRGSVVDLFGLGLHYSLQGINVEFAGCWFGVVGFDLIMKGEIIAKYRKPQLSLAQMLSDGKIYYPDLPSARDQFCQSFDNNDMNRVFRQVLLGFVDTSDGLK